MTSQGKLYRGLRLETLESRLLLASDSGQAWGDPNISYSLVPDGTEISGHVSRLFAELDTIAPREAWQRELDRALQTWAQVAPLNFHRTFDDGSSWATPGAGQQDPRFGDIRLSAIPLDGVIAQSHLPSDTEVVGGDIVLNSDETFSVGGLHDLHTVFLREIGVALGVDYEVGESSEPGYETRTELTPEEVTAIQSLYGARADDAFDAVAPNDDIDSATPLTVGSDGHTTVTGDISSPVDVDFYSFVVPSEATGRWEISMNTRGISLLAPLLLVYNSAGVLVGWSDTTTVRTVELAAPGSGLVAPEPLAAVPAARLDAGNVVHAAADRSYASTAAVSFRDVTPGDVYYVAAQRASDDGFGGGKYGLNSLFFSTYSEESDIAPTGVLEKTWHSYLTRESADIVSMPNYASSDWSAEMALDLDPYDYIGDYGEFLRHGQRYSAFNVNSAGWTISTDSSGYRAADNVTILATVSDGGGQNVQVGAPSQSGRLHVVITYDVSASNLSMYINGQLVANRSNANIDLPADLGGQLAIGATSKIDATYTPNVNEKAMPKFDMYFARVWNDDLTADEVSRAYARWIRTGRIPTPQGITAETVVAYEMNSEAADADGSPGTGWVRDAVGGNHLKIVDTGVVAGPLSTLFVPSGVPRGVSPVGGVTDVSGAVYLKADGVADSGLIKYFFEIDEVSSYDSSELKRSGWQLAKGQWQPLLKPSTTYYWRVKVRAVTPNEGVWSPTYTFTTRAPATWYVRPKAEPAAYGQEDGSSYENAWNDLRWNGPANGVRLAELVGQADFQAVAPGDTVYLTDDWGLMESDSWSLRSSKPEVRMLRARGHSAEFPVHLHLDHPDHPARFYQFFRFTGDYAWMDEGNGVYSTDQYLDTRRIGIDVGGAPKIDVDDPQSDTLLYKDATQTLAEPGFYFSDGRMYVQMPDNANPGNRLWYLKTGVETHGLNLLSAKHVHLVGGEFYGTSPVGSVPGSETTHFHLENTRFKYNEAPAVIHIRDFTDYWTIDNVEISYAKNGIYGWNTGDLDGPTPRRTGDHVTVRNSHIHHIGVPGWEDGDAHAVGVQSGNHWVIEDNLFENTGTAIEFWDSSKESKDHKIRRNVIQDVTAKNVTYGAGIALTGGGVPLGLRTGIEIVDNVIMNTDGSGIQSSVGDPVLVAGNLIMNVGLGDQDFSWDGISFRNVASTQTVQATIRDNVVYNPRDRFINIGGQASDGSGLIIDHNVYWADPPQSADDTGRFRAAGFSSSSFNSWVANTPFDQNSVWADPRTTTLPDGFEPLKVDLFMAEVAGDLNGDGRVEDEDMDLLLAAPSISPDGPSPAYIRFLRQEMD